MLVLDIGIILSLFLDFLSFFLGLVIIYINGIILNIIIVCNMLKFEKI